MWRSRTRRAAAVALVWSGWLAGAQAADAPHQKKPADIVGAKKGAKKGTKKLAAKKPTKKPAALLLPTRATKELARARSTLDELLADTVKDLGMRLDTDARNDERNADESELAALAEARGRVVILPLLRSVSGSLELRLLAARPGSRVVMTRVERAAADELSERAVVMLRDIVRESGSKPSAPEVKPRPAPVAEPERGAGRAILAINGTLYGGFIGFSVQRASGSDDPRLLYPLMGVGAGLGLGAAIIVADEWNVGVGDAWYLAAGAWWPAVAGHLIYEGRFGDTPTASTDEAWSFGLIASTTGFTLSTVGLLSRGMGDGGAVLAHSGGALGLIVGGLTEFSITGTAEEVPFAGLGYGAAAGWLLASATAVHFHPDAVRALTIDLGILLGGLAGASAASPLLFEEPDANKTRGWVAATGGGLIVGGIVAWWLSKPDDPDPQTALWLRYVPHPALVGTPPRIGEVAAPGPGLELSGDLW